MSACVPSRKHVPLRIGLTGGIASGKSVVSGLFARLGAEVIDADVISREVVKPGTDGLREVIATLGDEFLGPGGKLDRRKLRDAIFIDSDKRRALESILHPRIFAEMEARADAATTDYVVLVIPLLSETGAHARVDRVLLVDCDEPQQVARLMARDDIDEAAARSMLAAQASPEERRLMADDVVDNRGGLDRLERQVRGLHRYYLDLAGAERASRNDQRGLP